MSSRKFVSLFLAGVAVFSLSACETFDNSYSNMFKKPQVEEGKVDVVSYYDPRYYDSNYDQVATEMSNSDITVYGYDGGPVAGDMPAPGTPPDAKPYRAPKANVQDVKGVTVSDPSVTVYPFDDGAYQPQKRVGGAYGSSPAKLLKKKQYRSPWGEMPSTSSMYPMPAPVPVNSSQGNSAPRPTLQPVQQADSRMPSRIYFAHDSKALTNSGKQVIDHVAKSYEGGNISVEGHASSRADQPTTVERKIANLKVSMERALTVSNALMKDGVPASSIETKAYGDTRPPLVGVGMDPEAAARRVEIYSK